MIRGNSFIGLNAPENWKYKPTKQIISAIICGIKNGKNEIIKANNKKLSCFLKKSPMLFLMLSSSEIKGLIMKKSSHETFSWLHRNDYFFFVAARIIPSTKVTTCQPTNNQYVVAPASSEPDSTATAAAVTTSDGLKKAVFTRFKPIVIPDNVASALKDIKASKLVNKLIYTPKIGMINDIPVRTNAVIANAFIISSFL